MAYSRINYNGFNLPDTKNTEGFVYFILSEETGLVKIGVTTDLRRRVRALQTASPVELKLMGKIIGNRWREERFHLVFREYRERGEWFRYEGEVRDFVEGLAKKN